jgi:hypothetical protein
MIQRNSGHDPLVRRGSFGAAREPPYGMRLTAGDK